MKKDAEYWFLWTLLLFMMILSALHFMYGEIARGFIDLFLYIIGVFYLVWLKSEK